MNPLIRLAEETVQQERDPLIGMGNTLSMFMILMLAIATGYCLYTWNRLRKECMLFPNKFMYPGNCKPEDCLDEDGFIDFIQPKLLIFGLLLLACTVSYAAAYFLNVMGTLVDIVTVFVPLVIFGWYIYVQNRAAKEFWKK